MNVKLSVALIVKDEAERLPRCLASLADFDEIVVHDTGSSDGTMEVARRHGAQVVFATSPIVPFHFAEARNRALARCSHPWIVSVDADEEFEPGAADAIRHAIDDTVGRDVAGFKVWFRFDPGLVEYDRFVVFSKNRWTWANRVHNELVPVGAPGTVLLLRNVRLAHFEPMMERRVWRAEQTFELLKIEVAENPAHVRAWRHLACEYALRDDMSGAFRAMRKYLARTKEGPLELSQGHLLMGRWQAEAGHLDEAMSAWRKAAALFPGRREPHWYAALALMKAGRHREAIFHLENAIAIPEAAKPDYNQNDEAAWGNFPRRTLEWCRRGLDDGSLPPQE